MSTRTKISEKLKNKIIDSGIIRKEDFDNAPDWALSFAVNLLQVSEIEEFCSSDVSRFEIEKFLEELTETQDIVDINSCDKVSENFSERMQSFKFGVPNKIIPYLRQVAMPEIRENLE